MTYTVYARNASRALTGVIPYNALEMRLVYRGVGAWTLTMDPADPKAALLVAGTGILVLDDATGNVILSGPVRSPGEELPEPSGDEPVKPTLTVAGVTDEWHLSTRLVYPDPTSVASSQGAEDYWTLSDDAETVMRTLVDLNAGPGALTAREVAGLTLEPDAERGPVIKASHRFDNLLAAVTEAAVAGGLGWRILQDGANLPFHVFEPVDRSASIRFSTGVGNLRSYLYSLTGPTATRAIVGGSGEGTSRAFVERGDTAAETDWGCRIEVFRDRRDTGDTDTLNQSGDELLAEQSPTAAMSLTAVDTPNIRYGQHYTLGDTVTAIVRGTTIADVVREVRISADADGVSVRPVIGPDGTSDPESPQIYDTVRRLARRVAELEARR